MDQNHFRNVIGLEKINSIDCLECRSDSGQLHNCSFVLFSIYSHLQTYSFAFLRAIGITLNYYFRLISTLVKVLMKLLGNLFGESDYHLILVVENV